jgi:DNA topoisomerase-1
MTAVRSLETRASGAGPSVGRSRARGIVRLLELANDPVASARVAGLRHVDDSLPAIRRLKRGKGFSYVSANGSRVSSSKELDRIRSLAIPPAWTQVWICADPDGHIQATGRDARRRKQYRYHPRWREVRDESKYGRMLAFAGALPKIRSRVAEDMARAGLPREKLLAVVTHLLERTLIRIGNEEYARTNDSFGLTTLRDRMAEVHGTTVTFHFRGKSGVVHEIDVHDRKLARIVRTCQDLPGQELFQYLDPEGRSHAVDSSDVNGYLHEVAGDAFTAKDFRTWFGTLLAARQLGAPSADAPSKARVLAAIKAVARELGNTPSVCRKCYVHPGIITRYLRGALPPFEESPAGTHTFALTHEEVTLTTVLREEIE